MRIGFVPVTDGHGGGVYQYSETMRTTLHAMLDDELAQDELVLFLDEPGDADAVRIDHPRVSISTASIRRLRLIPEGRVRDALRRLLYRSAFTGSRAESLARSSGPMGERLRGERIDLMLYPAPRPLAYQVDVPYVAAVHDLQHRLQPEFPEVSQHGELEKRELLFTNLIANATTVVVDSEVGREDVLELYASTGITGDRVQVLPFLPPPYLDDAGLAADAVAEVGRRHRLPDRYMLLPAQFWPHKNHARVIRALRLLADEYAVRVPLVLVGSHSGALREQVHAEVMQLAVELGVDDLVHDLGFVPDADMPGLYRGAELLMFPTFFGPTNIPVVEAWAAGIPVVTSDVRGIREQCGDAAVLVDPRSSDAIAAGVVTLWDDAPRRAALVAAGTERLHRYTADDYRRRLATILADARRRLAG